MFYGLPFGTVFAWFGTPVLMVILLIVIWFIEDQRDLTEWEGEPINVEKYMKKKGRGDR